MQLDHTTDHQSEDHRRERAVAAPERLRHCIVTHEVLPVDGLVRFVVAPDGGIVPDIEGRLPGRGLWLCAARGILNRACAENMFAKATRAPVSVPEDLAQRVEALLVRRCTDLIGLARRAGDAVAGFERVRSMLSGVPVGMILIAGDAVAGEERRLRAMQPEVPASRVLRGAELGGVFGRASIVYGSVLRGGLASKLAIDAGRLGGVRDLEETER